ncbi:hypothetical protein [Shewanella algae]|uniref:hypothetical protein n=1 Tax=Shewanella algae TaxID=38313 RepID=UPI0031F5B30E
MANPNPTPLTAEARKRGGQNQRRGKGKKTIARELLEQVASNGDASLELLSQALAGRQGSALQVELVKQLFAASLEVAGQKDVARFKATQRNKELVLQAVLKHSSQKQAVELYKQLEAAEKGDVEEEEDEQEDQSNA